MQWYLSPVQIVAPEGQPHHLALPAIQTAHDPTVEENARPLRHATEAEEAQAVGHFSLSERSKGVMTGLQEMVTNAGAAMGLPLPSATRQADRRTSDCHLMPRWRCNGSPAAEVPV